MVEFRSQSLRILDLIKRNNDNGGTTNKKLSNISLKYSSRISELRQDGHDIYAKRVWRKKRATHTFIYFINLPKRKWWK